MYASIFFLCWHGMLVPSTAVWWYLNSMVDKCLYFSEFLLQYLLLLVYFSHIILPTTNVSIIISVIRTFFSLHPTYAPHSETIHRWPTFCLAYRIFILSLIRHFLLVCKLIHKWYKSTQFIAKRIELFKCNYSIKSHGVCLYFSQI